jgi:hypothetical protein
MTNKERTSVLHALQVPLMKLDDKYFKLVELSEEMLLSTVLQLLPWMLTCMNKQTLLLER